jgi:hypothetical protein
MAEMIELLGLVLLELEWLDSFYENVGHILCGAFLYLMECVWLVGTIPYSGTGWKKGAVQ